MRRQQPVPRAEVPAAPSSAPTAFMQTARAYTGASSARSSRSSLRTAGSFIDTDDSDGYDGDETTPATTPESPEPSKALRSLGNRGGDFAPPKRVAPTTKPSFFKRMFSSSKPTSEPAREGKGSARTPSLRRKRARVSSKSPESKWPKTWAEYDKLYARGEIDVNDPPPPPPASTWTGEGPPPDERGVYQAPEPVEERTRQTV